MKFYFTLNRHLLNAVGILILCHLTACRVSEENTVKRFYLTELEVDTLTEKALKDGDSEAALRLSTYYGLSLNDNVKEMEWLEKSAALGNALAKENLESRAQAKRDKAEMREKRRLNELKENSVKEP